MMRTALTTGALCLASLMAVQAASTDDKEKKEREELEKTLARIEPDLEKTEAALKTKQLIGELTKLLEKAEQVDLLRINHQSLEKDGKAEKSFHGHEVLTEVRVVSKDQRKNVVEFMVKTLHWNELRKALCFDPNHGMRVVSGDRTLDFLICFSCNRVRIYDGETYVSELALGFTNKDNPLEKCMAEIEKQRKDKR